MGGEEWGDIQASSKSSSLQHKEAAYHHFLYLIPLRVHDWPYLCAMSHLDSVPIKEAQDFCACTNSRYLWWNLLLRKEPENSLSEALETALGFFV